MRASAGHGPVQQGADLRQVTACLAREQPESGLELGIALGLFVQEFDQCPGVQRTKIGAKILHPPYLAVSGTSRAWDAARSHT